MAEKLASKSPLILKLLKRVLTDGMDMPLSVALRQDQAVIGLVLDSRDARQNFGFWRASRTMV